MPASVLQQAPSKAFFEQNGFISYNSSKFVSSKTESKVQTDLDRVKSEKGISERLLLRTTTGFNRNLFYNRQNKEDTYHLKSTEKMMNNNYFNKTESSKTYTRQNLTNYHSVYVKKWVDYSSKYGLGYLLSDGTTGIYFNDSTKMIIDETGQYF